jgi:hypothetical protein
MAHAGMPQPNLNLMLGALQTFTNEAQHLRNSPFVQQDTILINLRNDINNNHATSTANVNELTVMVRDLTGTVRTNNELLTVLSRTVTG